MDRADYAQDMDRFLVKLGNLGLNIPEVIMSTPFKEDVGGEKTAVYVSHVLGALRDSKTKTVLRLDPSQTIQYLSPQETSDIIESLVDKKFILIRAPRGKTIHNGHCTISPLYNRVSLYTLSGTSILDISIAWGDNIDHIEDKSTRAFLYELCLVLIDLRGVLDGSTIRFCYSSRSEGMLARQLVFWGM